eukprot:3168852-Rhodomonas_salina.1
MLADSSPSSSHHTDAHAEVGFEGVSGQGQSQGKEYPRARSAPVASFALAMRSSPDCAHGATRKHKHHARGLRDRTLSRALVASPNCLSPPR